MIFELHNGDCVEAMRKMPEASVGAVVTDPPYGLEFMGKEWDKLDSQRGGNPNWKPSKPHVSTGERGVQYGAPKKMPRCRRCGKLKIGNGACICAVPDWDTRHAEQGFRMQAWHERWAREVYRVLKPGGYLLAFGGTRTYHRMVCAIEDAGFEIRDSIDWIYGSGFPKSLDIGKAIDKAAGVEREVVGRRTSWNRPDSEEGHRARMNVSPGDFALTAPSTDVAKQWDGWGTALKPAHEPIVVARKPLIGTVVDNILEHGVGGINVDGCRVATGEKWTHGGNSDEALDRQMIRQAGHRAPAEGHPSGRWPPNVVLTHHPDCKPIGMRKVKGDGRGDCQGKRPSGFGNVGAESGDAEPNAFVYGDDEIEAWVCVEGCPVVEMDRQSGDRPAGARLTGNEPRSDGMSGAVYGNGKGSRSFESYADNGGASRFFPCFCYVAKASRAEREAGCEGLSRQTASEMTDRQEGSAGLKHARSGTCPTDGARNFHPTVKPIDLMRWLVRLVTPPGGVVLDPFMGSGTTGIACHKERFGFIGIELDKDYFKIAEARIAAARAQLRLF